jgi:hypothetical protein
MKIWIVYCKIGEDQITLDYWDTEKKAIVSRDEWYRYYNNKYNDRPVNTWVNGPYILNKRGGL